jgi:hypothetical protein
MGSDVKSSLENSGWIQVDDATYQLKEDYDRLAKVTLTSSMNFFLQLVKAAERSPEDD